MAPSTFDTVAERRDFAQYGEACLLLNLHLTTLSHSDFFDRYKTTKRLVQHRMEQLQTAIEFEDPILKNEVYDFFIEVL